MSSLAELKKNWHIYFNPCGVELINGYALQRCPSPDCYKFKCLPKMAYAMAGFVLDGSSIFTEELELRQYLSSLSGSQVVSVDGSTVALTTSNIPGEIKKITVRAGNILNGIDSCLKNSDPNPETFYVRSSPELQQVLTRYKKLSTEGDQFHGDLAAATSLVDQIQATLQEAIILGGDKMGLIARRALAFGLADQLPAIDETGLIFTGNTDKLIATK